MTFTSILSFAATAEWFLFEGLYFLVQFALIGLALAFIHRPKKGATDGV